MLVTTSVGDVFVRAATAVPDAARTKLAARRVTSTATSSRWCAANCTSGEQHGGASGFDRSDDRRVDLGVRDQHVDVGPSGEPDEVVGADFGVVDECDDAASCSNLYDDADFVSEEMCCACGGGSTNGDGSGGDEDQCELTLELTGDKKFCAGAAQGAHLGNFPSGSLPEECIPNALAVGCETFTFSTEYPVRARSTTLL